MKTRVSLHCIFYGSTIQAADLDGELDNATKPLVAVQCTMSSHDVAYVTIHDHTIRVVSWKHAYI
jgi:hypothetical protein